MATTFVLAGRASPAQLPAQPQGTCLGPHLVHAQAISTYIHWIPALFAIHRTTMAPMEEMQAAMINRSIRTIKAVSLRRIVWYELF